VVKKLILVLGLACALTLLFGGIASADAGPHGGYTTTTAACAGCHRAHTGQAENLLKAGPQQTDFCFACHGNGGLGAATNVQGGQWMDPTARQDPYGGGASFNGNVVGRGLKGGGFATTLMDTALTGSVNGPKPTTSRHRTDDPNAIMWGGGAVNSGKGPQLTLKCADCHGPHGRASSTKTPTYRILRGRPTIGTGTEPGDVPDVDIKVYTIDSANGQYTGQPYTNMTQISAFCGYCHVRIHAASATASGDALYNYRHVTLGTNTEPDYTKGFPGCLTCHVAHGTSAAMEGYATQVTVDGTAIDSALLRLDNRGVCEICHNK